MTTKEKVLQSLRANTEGCESGGFKMVYLDNARLSDVSEYEFRSALAQLSKDGLYKVIDGYAFGEIKV